MKIIHCADLHIGLENGPIDKETMFPLRVQDFLDSFDAMVAFAIQEEVDAILIAGDIFHRNNPNPMLLNAFASRISEVAESLPVVILVGNHDTPGPLHRRSSVDVFGELRLPNVYLGNKFETVVVKTKSGSLQVTTFPYPTRHIVSDGSLVSWEDYHERVRDVLIRLRQDIDVSIPSVFLGHFTVSGSKFGSERPLIIGNDAEVDIFELLNWEPGDGPVLSLWDYFALGHIHYHQEVFDSPPIIYAGSLDRVDFGDEGVHKGFVLVNISKTEDKAVHFYTSWEFIDVDARPMKTVEINAVGQKRPYKKITDVVSKIDIDGAIVKALIEVDTKASVPLEEFTKLLYEQGAKWVVGVSIKTPIDTTTRLDGDRSASSYTNVELLEVYFQDVEDDAEYNELMDLAEDIMSEAQVIDYDSI